MKKTNILIGLIVIISISITFQVKEIVDALNIKNKKLQVLTEQVKLKNTLLEIETTIHNDYLNNYYKGKKLDSLYRVGDQQRMKIDSLLNSF